MMDGRSANIGGEDLTPPSRLPAGWSRRGGRIRELRIRTLLHREQGTVPPERAGEAPEHWDEIGNEKSRRRIREP